MEKERLWGEHEGAGTTNILRMDLWPGTFLTCVQCCNGAVHSCCGCLFKIVVNGRFFVCWLQSVRAIKHPRH